jgi:hypothetical protein
MRLGTWFSWEMCGVAERRCGLRAFGPESHALFCLSITEVTLVVLDPERFNPGIFTVPAYLIKDASW